MSLYVREFVCSSVRTYTPKNLLTYEPLYHHTAAPPYRRTIAPLRPAFASFQSASAFGRRSPDESGRRWLTKRCTVMPLHLWAHASLRRCAALIYRRFNQERDTVCTEKWQIGELPGKSTSVNCAIDVMSISSSVKDDVSLAIVFIWNSGFVFQGI